MADPTSCKNKVIQTILGRPNKGNTFVLHKGKDSKIFNVNLKIEQIRLYKFNSARSGLHSGFNRSL